MVSPPSRGIRINLLIWMTVATHISRNPMKSSTLSRHALHIFVGSRSFFSIWKLYKTKMNFKSFVCDDKYENTYSNSNTSEYYVAQIVWTAGIVQNVYRVVAKWSAQAAQLPTQWYILTGKTDFHFHFVFVFVFRTEITIPILWSVNWEQSLYADICKNRKLDSYCSLIAFHIRWNNILDFWLCLYKDYGMPRYFQINL